MTKVTGTFVMFAAACGGIRLADRLSPFLKDC